MKKMMLSLSAAALLLCLINCSPEEKNKGRFARNIPICIKQKIEKDYSVWRADEYCSTDDTEKIYVFLNHPSVTLNMIGYDENCNLFLVEAGENTWKPLNPDEWLWGYLLSDGTIEYKEDIYHFKRIVFTQK